VVAWLPEVWLWWLPDDPLLDEDDLEDEDEDEEVFVFSRVVVPAKPSSGQHKAKDMPTDANKVFIGLDLAWMRNREQRQRLPSPTRPREA
jgi:hypothetical protein